MQSDWMQGRLLFADGLRAVAIMMVILYHCHLFYGNLPQGVQAAQVMGLYGVSVFFVVSGFVIAMTLTRRPVDAGGLVRFLARRSIRLDPPYWVSILVCCLLSIGERGDFPASIGLYVSHLLYVQRIVGYPDLNTAYWTLTLEFQFYLLFGLLVWLVPQRLLGSVFWLTAVASAAAHFLNPQDAGIWVPYHWFDFMAGSLTFWALRGRLPVWGWGAYIVVLYSLGLASIGYAPYHLGPEAAEANLGVVATTAVALYYACVRGRSKTWLSGRVLQFIGVRSYSIYLLHIPIILGWLHLVMRLGWYGHAAMGVIYPLGSILLSTLGAHLLYVLVEKPYMALSRRVTAH